MRRPTSNLAYSVFSSRLLYLPPLAKVVQESYNNRKRSIFISNFHIKRDWLNLWFIVTPLGYSLVHARTPPETSKLAPCRWYTAGLEGGSGTGCMWGHKTSLCVVLTSTRLLGDRGWEAACGLPILPLLHVLPGMLGAKRTNVSSRPAFICLRPWQVGSCEKVSHVSMSLLTMGLPLLSRSGRCQVSL